MNRSRLLLPWIAALLPLTGCATFDDFLGISLGDTPAVVVDGHLHSSDHDTLLVVGVAGAEVIDGLQYQLLHLFLHNTGKEVVAVNATDQATTTYLPFTPIDRRQFPELVEMAPELAGLDLFALHLRGLGFAQEAPASPRTVRDFGLSNMPARQIGMVGDRRVLFVVQPLDPDRSRHYASRLGATFADGDDLP